MTYFISNRVENAVKKATIENTIKIASGILNYTVKLVETKILTLKKIVQPINEKQINSEIDTFNGILKALTSVIKSLSPIEKEISKTTK